MNFTAAGGFGAKTGGAALGTGNRRIRHVGQRVR
jgi:hypothetical protein